MGPKICTTLPTFYTFTGCNIASACFARGKKTAWSTCKVYPKAFEGVPLMQTETSDMAMEKLERLRCCFIIIQVIS